jgi:hypothetical protein
VRLIGEAKRQADEKDSVQCIRSGLKRTPNGFFTGFAWSPDFDQKTKEAMTTDPLKSSSLLFILLLFKSFKQVSGHLVSDFRTTFANHDARRSTAARYVFGTRSLLTGCPQVFEQEKREDCTPESERSTQTGVQK